MEKETHDTIIAEPGNRYIDHVSPQTGKAADKAKEILNLIKENNASVVVIGSDGTSVNTGCHGGVNRLIELGLNKACQHAICGLHLNELPLKHVFRNCDGGSSGPSSFKGPIGTAIQKDIIGLPIVSFKSIAVWLNKSHLVLQTH